MSFRMLQKYTFRSAEIGENKDLIPTFVSMIKKVEVLSAIQALLQNQIDDYLNELESVNEEIGKETKSSAGDKFETSREMMNQEISRLEERIAYSNKQLNTLKQLTRKKSEQVENGSLVYTNQGAFFFGLAFGKLSIEATTIMGLSLNSPIGKAISGKKVNDSFTFVNRDYSIQKIS